MMRSVYAALAFTPFLLCCSGAAGDPSEADAGDAVATSVECAKASALCADGKCAVEVANECKTPVTCQLEVESLCQANEGPMSPSSATSKKVTQLAGTTQTLEAEPTCTLGA
ncbi:MAG: hypothetical protein HOW73_50570, partial [Polyangiaceae bacterium]|nr:hypothetical protein [Polyangiaceae bacterium]